MANRFVLATVAAVLMLGGFAWAGPAGDLAMMPADNFNGWKRAGNPRVFTEADLYGYIDGGAELFLEFGFERLTQQKFTRPGSEFTVDLYRMTDPIAAIGTYLMKCGKETRRPAFSERHTVNKHQLMFQRDRFFVIVSSGSGQEALIGDMVAFGGALASKMPVVAPLRPLTQLPKAGQVEGTLRLLRGQYALQSIFTLGDGDILQLGRSITAVAADYKDSSGAWSRIEVVYPDASAAAKAFAWLSAHLDSYLKPIEKAPARLVFRDYENKFGLVKVSAATLDIRVHLAAKPAL